MCPGRRGARRAGSSTVGCSDWAALWAWVQLGAEQRGLPRLGSIPAHRTASEAGELALPLTHVLTAGLCPQPPCSCLPSPTPEPRRAVSVLLAHPLSLCPARALKTLSRSQPRALSPACSVTDGESHCHPRNGSPPPSPWGVEGGCVFSGLQAHTGGPRACRTLLEPKVAHILASGPW